ncbi:Hsp70 family protein [Dactylosporangium sp. NPDC000555]|uniref:Hsp70 family protein n=1 Tax=Dactylosporangium sp. NPDC000555 TaxID=3154260 RepID=UPI00331A6997
MGGYHLGIDFGTARTAAVLARPDGRREQLLLEPSAVCLDNAPHFVAGFDAVEAGEASPDRFEPHPRRTIDKGSVVLGGVECPVRSLFAAVLTHVGGAARRVAGGPMSGVGLTHPAGWHRPQIAVLERAAALVGLRPARLVPEPVAAALHAEETGLLAVPDGASVAVVDLGAGSADAAVVQRTGRTFALLSSASVAEAGGLALDAAILAHLGSAFARRSGSRWKPGRALLDRALLDGAREGREELTASKAATIPVPWADSGMALTRTEFESLARPPLRRAMQALTSIVAGAGGPEPVGVLLTGGLAHTPLVTELLVETLGLFPVHLEGPVLAEGALLADPSLVPRRPRPVPEAPPPADPWAALQRQSVTVAAPPRSPAAPPRPVALEPWEIRAELWTLEQDKPWRYERELLAIRAECRAAEAEYRTIKAELVAAARELAGLRSEMDLASTDLSAAGTGLRAAGAELDEFEDELELMATRFRTPRAAAPAPEPGPDVLATLRAITEAVPRAPAQPPAAEPEADDFGALVRVMRRYLRSSRRGPVAEPDPPDQGADGQGDPAGEPPLSDVAVSPAPRFPAPRLTLADRSVPPTGSGPRARTRSQPAGPRPHRRVRMRPAVSAGLTLFVALVALGAGTLVALKLTGSLPEREFRVGDCVAQRSDRATVVDCDARGAFEITKQISRADRCPDAGQPFVIRGEALYCLVPVPEGQRP